MNWVWGPARSGRSPATWRSTRNWRKNWRVSNTPRRPCCISPDLPQTPGPWRRCQVGTLSKAFAAQGGYVAGSRTLIDYLIHRARPLLFSTSHPPSVAASALAALRLVQEEPELIERLWDNTRIFKQGLNELGFNTGASETPITPVVVGDEQLATDLSDRLFTAGVFALGIVFPTVPRGKARVRTIVTAAHTRTHLQRALDAFAKVGRELRLI